MYNQRGGHHAHTRGGRRRMPITPSRMFLIHTCAFPSETHRERRCGLFPCLLVLCPISLLESIIVRRFTIGNMPKLPVTPAADSDRLIS